MRRDCKRDTYRGVLVASNNFVVGSVGVVPEGAMLCPWDLITLG